MVLRDGRIRRRGHRSRKTLTNDPCAVDGSRIVAMAKAMTKAMAPAIGALAGGTGRWTRGRPEKCRPTPGTAVSPQAGKQPEAVGDTATNACESSCAEQEAAGHRVAKPVSSSCGQQAAEVLRRTASPFPGVGRLVRASSSRSIAGTGNGRLK
jgi:hypothetical protein